MTSDTNGPCTRARIYTRRMPLIHYLHAYVYMHASTHDPSSYMNEIEKNPERCTTTTSHCTVEATRKKHCIPKTPNLNRRKFAPIYWSQQPYPRRSWPSNFCSSTRKFVPLCSSRQLPGIVCRVVEFGFGAPSPSRTVRTGCCRSYGVAGH